MKTLTDEILDRLHEVLPDNDQETAFGAVQWEDSLRVLAAGQVLVVFRRPGSIAVTHALPPKRQGL
jgi:hypothetical protein